MVVNFGILIIFDKTSPTCRPCTRPSLGVLPHNQYIERKISFQLDGGLYDGGLDGHRHGDAT